MLRRCPRCPSSRQPPSRRRGSRTCVAVASAPCEPAATRGRHVEDRRRSVAPGRSGCLRGSSQTQLLFHSPVFVLRGRFAITAVLPELLAELGSLLLCSGQCRLC